MYSARINGEPTTFGTSGMLYRSNKLMYDRATESLWNQFTGEPVIGPLADSGIVLPFFPSELTTWQEWVARHPDTTVISADTGLYPSAFYTPESDPSSIYYDFRKSPDVMFPVWNRDDAVGLKQVVLGVGVDGAYKAYPVDRTQAERVINDAVGAVNVVVLGSAESEAARAYERGAQTFALGGDAEAPGLPAVLVDGSGEHWKVTEEALVSESDGSTLLRVPTLTAFWHGWYSFHPYTEVYRGE